MTEHPLWHTDDPETSSQAAPTPTAAGNQRQHVYAHLAAHGPATADELEQALGDILGERIAARRLSELKREGRAVDTGVRRRTRSGNNAAVLRAVHPGELEVSNAPAIARARLERRRRELTARIADAVDQVNADRLPRAVRIDDLDITIIVRPNEDPTRPPLPA